MTHRFKLYQWCLLAFFPVSVMAQDRDSAEIDPDSVGALGRQGDTVEEPTFMDLLEFLGEFETEDGRWIDPGELLDEVEAEGSTSDANIAGNGDNE